MIEYLFIPKAIPDKANLLKYILKYNERFFVEEEGMGDREAEYNEDFICDVCGNKGAYDFYGDYICDGCIDHSPSKDQEK